MARADHVALDAVQLLEAGNGNPVFAGDFPEAVAAAHLVVAVLGEFLLVAVFDRQEFFLLDGGECVDERAFFEVEDAGGVDVGAVEAHFEVQVRPEGTARVAADADGIAGLDRIADVDLPAGEVGVEGGKAVAVVQNDVFAVTPAAALVADLGDDSREGGHDGAVFAMAKAEVYAAVHAVGTDAVGCRDAPAGRGYEGGSHVEDELAQGIHGGGIGGIHVGGQFGVGLFLAHFGTVVRGIGFIGRGDVRGACLGVVGDVAGIRFVYNRVAGKFAFGLGTDFILGKGCQGYHADYQKDL